jgi:hypothetical protein
MSEGVLYRAVEWWESISRISVPGLDTETNTLTESGKPNRPPQNNQHAISIPIGTINSVQRNAWLLLELFSCRDNLVETGSAWPRKKGFKHMVLLGAGADAGSNRERERERGGDRVLELELGVARGKILSGHGEILGWVGGEGEGEMKRRLDVIPNSIEEYHDVRAIYGGNWDRLSQIKREWDPRDRLGGHIRP